MLWLRRSCYEAVVRRYQLEGAGVVNVEAQICGLEVVAKFTYNNYRTKNHGRKLCVFLQ